jgi:SET domain-containing protein
MARLVRKPKIDPRYCLYKLLIRQSRIHRRGVYAGEDIPAGRKVIEYTGEKINNRERLKREINYLTPTVTEPSTAPRR